MNTRVRITDVAPRDGLQAEQSVVPTSDKATLVGLVQQTGVEEVEVSSFVSPKWIPQLGDAAELFELVAASKPEGVLYSALVPNMRGLEAAIAVQARSRSPTAALNPAYAVMPCCLPTLPAGPCGQSGR